ncbi:hypothetical protein BDY24DRAFT_397980 [Mrakia frigida]|uniref:uncharacterized protein n=1 Tax=Mrakia frigida TaxID=29902 RepID=UPI003FCC21E9
MSTPSRSRIPANSSRSTPSRTGSSASTSSSNTSSVNNTPRPTSSSSSFGTPVRVSIKDQIKALRAAQATPQPASNQGTPLARREEIKGMIRKAHESGRLVIPTTLTPPLKFLPPSLYTTLLSIPAKELSRKPPRPPAVTAPNFSLSTPDKLAARLDSALSLQEEEGVFGGKSVRAREEEESEGWIGFGTDLETLKVVAHELEELDLELGLFGGLKVIDFRHNKLTAVPSSFFNLTLLTYLNLSHNALTSFPPPLTLLPSLVELHLNNNSLTKLSFAMPPPSPIFPSSPPSAFSSPPPPGEPLDRPLPSLQILHLEGNKLTYAGLPSMEDDWPPRLSDLQLGENPLLPSRSNGELALDAFVAISKLKRLSVPGCGVRTLAVKGREEMKVLEVVDLKGNQWLERDGLERGGWVKEVAFLATEKGDEMATKLTILIDPHLIPKPGKRSAPAVVIASSQPEEEPDFFAPAAPRPTNGRRTGAVKPPAPLNFGTATSSSSSGLGSEWDAPPTEAEKRFARARQAQAEQAASSSSPSTTEPSDGPGPYTTPYNSSSRSFTLNLTSKTPSPLFPTGLFSLSTLHSQSYASTLLTLTLSGRNLKSLSPESLSSELVFPSLLTLNITSCPSCSLKDLFPLLPTLFPKLENLDLSETREGELFLTDEMLLEKLMLGGGGGKGGLKKLIVREAGVKTTGGLDALARKMKVAEEEGGQIEGWRCEEIDLTDNALDKLEPALGYLPLRSFIVERNCFRQPAARVWEKGGTAALLIWLRERASLDQ